MVLLIKNGKVFQSDKNSFYSLDLLIDEKIIDISEKIPEEAADNVLDASGMSIIPGIIDVHSHGDSALFDQDYLNIRHGQGITTEIVGNCGFSVFPVVGDEKKVRIELNPILGEGARLFRDYSEYKSAASKIPMNVFSLIGHNTLILDGQRDNQRLVEDMLSQGAIGFSTGLDYYPGRESTTEQIRRIVARTGISGGIYATHHRSIRDYLYGLSEAREIAESSSTPLHISHLKPMKHLLEKALDIVNEGILTYDTQTYAMTSSNIQTLIPPSYYNLGIDVLLEELRKGDSAFREGIKEGSRYMIEHDLPWQNINIAYHPNKEYLGKNLAEIAADLRIDPWEAVFRLILESRGNCTITKKWLGLDEEVIHTVVKSPSCVISSDAIPSKTGQGYVFCHPRLFYTFPLALGNWVEDGILTLEEAVIKTSVLPARIFGLQNIGDIKKGYQADLVIFDPTRLNVAKPELNPSLPRAFFRDVFQRGNYVVRDYQFV